MKLFLKGRRCFTKCPMDRDVIYAPGMHMRRQKLTGYGILLSEKQKIKWYYGLTERQLLRYWEWASRQKGMPGTNLLLLLERRFDSLVFRSGMSQSLPQARQWITHSHFEVNGKILNIPSALLEVGSIVRIRPNSPLFATVVRNVKERQELGVIPNWIQVKPEDGSFVFVRSMDRSELPIPEIEERLVAEFYSR
ncbi:MAG: 30S ribosomal protein S4 [bacterium]